MAENNPNTEMVERVAHGIAEAFAYRDDAMMHLPLHTAKLCGRAAIRIIHAAVEAEWDRALAEYPDCQDGSDFEEFTSRVREMFVAALGKPTP